MIATVILNGNLHANERLYYVDPPIEGHSYILSCISFSLSATGPNQTALYGATEHGTWADGSLRSLKVIDNTPDFNEPLKQLGYKIVDGADSPPSDEGNEIDQLLDALIAQVPSLEVLFAKVASDEIMYVVDKSIAVFYRLKDNNYRLTEYTEEAENIFRFPMIMNNYSASRYHSKVAELRIALEQKLVSGIKLSDNIRKRWLSK